MDFISRLPNETLNKIFGYLNGNQLAKCSNVCRRFDAVAEDGIYWKNLCEFDWLITDLTNNFSTWKDCYADMYRRYGRYVKYYSRVKRCWDKIFAVTQERCPPIYNSLLIYGASEECLDEMQYLIGRYATLPLDYQCSYRLCNGQMRPDIFGLFENRPFTGLFGSDGIIGCGDYMCSCPGGERWDKSPILEICCMVFVYISDNRCIESNVRLALCLRHAADSRARKKCVHDAQHNDLNGRIVTVKLRDYDSSRMDLFVRNNSFIDFLEDFSSRISDYPTVNNRILKFDFNSSENTGPFTVTVGTAFCHDRSTAFPLDKRDLQFSYRITMKMHPDAPRCDSCQLMTRHWIITDADGKVETKAELGFGHNPVMRPGEEFSWVSRIGFATMVGKMSGYFTMRKVNDEGEIRIDCPEFVMVAPEIVAVPFAR